VSGYGRHHTQKKPPKPPLHQRVTTVLNAEFKIESLFPGELTVSRCLSYKLQKLLVEHLCPVAAQTVCHREAITWKKQTPSHGMLNKLKVVPQTVWKPVCPFQHQH